MVEFVQGVVPFYGTAPENATWTAEDDHLAKIAELLGPFPSSLLKKGRRSAELFDEQGITPSIYVALPLGCFTDVF